MDMEESVSATPPMCIGMYTGLGVRVGVHIPSYVSGHVDTQPCCSLLDVEQHTSRCLDARNTL